MVRVSTKLTALLVTLLIAGTSAYAQNQPWPLKRTIDLSSGFGDFRPNRFHSGVDLRTGGAVGSKVYSPVDGYVMRVKMSYQGYGKGLYIRGVDRHLYVLAHLDRFADPIQSTVRDHQFERERYNVDIRFPADSIRVKKGQLVAYSGKTGIGAPHLHFEKRTPDNVPINPLTHGFALNDTVPPSFERIGFQMLDNRSLFPGGVRKFFLPVRKVSPTEFVLDTVLYLSAPFGVLAHCYDQMRPGGMRQAVKRLTLKLDGMVQFETDLDSLPFEIGPVSALAYDMAEVANDEKRVRKLFDDVGTAVAAVGTDGTKLGRIGGETMDVGRHAVELVALDHDGNRSTLMFDFIYGPTFGLYVLDTCVIEPRLPGKCFYSPTFPLGSLPIDSSFAVYCTNMGARPVMSPLSLREMDNGWLSVEDELLGAVLSVRIGSRLKSGHTVYSFADTVHVGDCYRSQSVTPIVSEQIDHYGLIVQTLPDVNEDRAINLFLFDESGVATSVAGRTFPSLGQYGLFVPIKELTATIDSFQVQVGRGQVRTEHITLHVVGKERRESVSVDSCFRVSIQESDLFRPQLIAVKRSNRSSEPDIVAGPYRVLPEAFPVRSSFEVAMNLPSGNPLNRQTGLCWYDEKENEWVWIDEESENDNLAAGSSLGGGLFAAIVDTTAPELTKLNLKRGHKYWNAGLRVKFNLEDNLSGFEDDRSLDIRIDGDWLLPEFDIEDGTVVATQRRPLALGSHELTIRAVDRAGNEISRRVEFEVIKRSN